MMKITVHSSKSVKPTYSDGDRSCGDDNAPAATVAGAVVVIPLTVLDEVNHDAYIPGIFLFRPPSPPSAALEAGLAKVLSEYREGAGRLVVVDDASGKRAICLNDAGARFVEASADVALAAVMPMRMGPEAVKLHPSCDDGTEELLLVQVTRFPCGSFAVGTNMHHSVADGYTVSSFMLAWGQATRGGAIAGFHPVPVHDRVSFFVPRRPPLVEFEHRGNEFKEPEPSTRRDDNALDNDDDEVIVETVHFSREFIAQLKSRASAGGPSPKQQWYSAAQCVLAHLWRCITKARGLGGDEVTRLHIAVNGRHGRMTNPRVPEGYIGNVVLWARPATTARELVDDDDTPLRHTVELVSQAVARVDDRYFRSFIDFASSGVVERERLVRTAVSSELVARNDVEVDSLLGLPFYDLDFGTGKPVLFMPTYSTPQPVEGAVFLVPPSSGHGGVVAYVPLFRRAVEAFRRCCYSLPLVAEARL